MVAPLQSWFANIIRPDLKDDILCWLDDILIHSPTVDQLLGLIQSFFDLCVEYNIKLHRRASKRVHGTRLRPCWQAYQTRCHARSTVQSRLGSDLTERFRGLQARTCAPDNTRTPRPHTAAMSIHRCVRHCLVAYCHPSSPKRLTQGSSGSATLAARVSIRPLRRDPIWMVCPRKESLCCFDHLERHALDRLHV